MDAELVDRTREGHVPVLLREVMASVALQPGDRAVDCTFGGGGYTAALLEATRPNGRVLAIDRDPEAIERGTRMRRALGVGDCLVFVSGNFEDISIIARERGFENVAAVVADLGSSSWQLDRPDRGFSFSRDGVLDMRFDPSRSVETAAEIIATRSVDDLERIIRMYGEERHARTIACAIVAQRRRGDLGTTSALAALIAETLPRRGRIHPATRTFQALRIAVNDELGALRRAIPQMEDLVHPGGRIAIVTFHSLEDRIVKRAFRAAALRGLGWVVTAKPIVPTAEEIARNPRSRSAKLRVLERK